ncbi:MAG: hypothetical protein U9Q07_10710 [Planctomycetota bacterium]|nr:hypothetical protein [Planctomycetota bacterium]
MFNDVLTTDPSSEVTRAPRKMTRTPVVRARHGFLRCLHLCYICFVLPLAMPLAPICLRLYTLTRRTMLKYYSAEKKIRYWRQNKEMLLSLADRGYKTRIESLGLDLGNIGPSENIRQQSRRVEIAEIDQDGFLLSKVGTIANAPSVSEKQFLRRKRFGLRVVALDGYVCVEKHYKGNKASFVNEIEAHYHLGLAGCNIPVIMDVNFDNLMLTFSYISGPVLREELAGRGAVVRNRDIEDNPQLTRFDKRKRALRRVQECRRVLNDVIDGQFAERLFAELNKIHEARFIWNDIKYGNIIIEQRSGKPYMVDFDWALRYPRLTKNAFRILRDRDTERFNACFGTEKSTYKRIKRVLEHHRGDMPCAPVHFGFGLRTAGVWDTIIGCACCYSALKDHLPPISGKRILELGRNDTFDSIYMLRSGAREVVTVELASVNFSQGNFIKSAFEWADDRQYELRRVQANIEEIPNMNMGTFDMALALNQECLPTDHRLADLVKHVSTIADALVLQCDITTNTYRREQRTCERASVEYALNVLKSNGFPRTQVIDLRKCAHPLVIGGKDR